MFEDENGKKRLSKALTFYVYRNSIIENYHKINVKMNKELYKKIYQNTNKKVKNILLFQKCINASNKDTITNLLNSIPENYKLKFINYYTALCFNFKFGADWDSAELINAPMENENLAHYLLAGEFFKACNQNEILDDNVMKVINKDIHNRMYTLVNLNYFDM